MVRFQTSGKFGNIVYIEYIVHGSENGLLYDLTYFGAKLNHPAEIWANARDTSTWTRPVADGSKRRTHRQTFAPK